MQLIIDLVGLLILIHSSVAEKPVFREYYIVSYNMTGSVYNSTTCDYNPIFYDVVETVRAAFTERCNEVDNVELISLTLNDTRKDQVLDVHIMMEIQKNTLSDSQFVFCSRAIVFDYSNIRLPGTLSSLLLNPSVAGTTCPELVFLSATNQQLDYDTAKPTEFFKDHFQCPSGSKLRIEPDRNQCYFLECPPGWDSVFRPNVSSVPENGSLTDLVVCLKTAHFYTWVSGKKLCGEEFGFLANLASEYYGYDETFFSHTLEKVPLQSNGDANTYWTGGHIDSESGKFFWDGIPLLPIEYPSDPSSSFYAWQGNQPEYPKTGDCVAAIVYRGRDEKRLVKITTKPCTDELLVICQNKIFDPTFKQEPCQEGLYYHYGWCYLITEEVAATDKIICPPDMSLAKITSFEENKYVKALMLFFNRKTSAWIQYTRLKNGSWPAGYVDWVTPPLAIPGHPLNCTYVTKDGWTNSACSDAHSHICEKKAPGDVTFSEEPSNMTIRVNTRSQNQASDEKFINLTCIPSGDFVGITWRLNGNPVRLVSDSTGLVDLDHFEGGLYQCEAWSHTPFKKLVSKPALIKLWGVRHFIGQFKLPSGVFDRSRALYNWFEPKWVADLTPFEFTLFKSLSISLPQTVDRITTNQMHFSGGSLVVDFRLIVALNPLADIGNLNLLEKIQTIITTSASEFRIDPKSIQLMSTEFCPATNLEYRGEVYTFLETEVNKMGESSQICGTTGKPLAKLMCEGSFLIGASWSRNISVIECLEKESTVTRELRGLSQVEINDTNVGTSVVKTVELTADPNVLNTADVVYTSRIVDQITSLENVTRQTGSEVAKILNNILNVNSSVIGDAEKAYNASSRLTKSIETITNLVEFDEGADEIKTVFPNIAITVWKVDKSTVQPVLGIQVSSSTGNQGLQENSIQPVYKLSNAQNVTNIDIGIALPVSAVKPNDSLSLFNETKNSKNSIGYMINEDTSEVQTADDCAALCVTLYEQAEGNRTCVAFDFEAKSKMCLLRRSFGSLESLEPISGWSSYVYIPGWKTQQRLSFVVYNNGKLFQSRYERYGNISGVEEWITYSRVISAKINSRSLNIRLNEPLISTFLPTKKGHLTGEKVCGFWDYNLNDWSREGCWYNGSQDGRHMCMCDHLTNFALLLDVHGQSTPIPDDHKLALTIISIIGLSLSIIGLVCTVVTFLVFRFYTSTSPNTKTAGFRNLRKGRSQQSLFNLALALLFSMIVFLAGVEQTSNRAGCIAVAVLLHYFILVSFAWMLVEGVIQYLRFVKVLGTYIPRFMLKACLLAWGLPALVCVISLAVDYNLYSGGEQYCWLSRDLFYFAFMLPVCAIILVNIVFFTLVVRSLTCARASLQTNQSERKTAILHLNAAICTLVLLGITWVFGFFAINDARLAFQYIFCICNSLQGFFIFIFFNVREKQVRAAWRSICCKAKLTGQYALSHHSESSSQGATKSSNEADAKKVLMEPLEMKNQQL